ncbi:glycoside hydrolase family 88 protein [Pluralibacter sp.]|uniref:beta-galactosidase BglB n=1 Tax=Pluralibacter sp. TaxID=1920032 RepID=UPI0025DA8222|nr:glycoside hydrolase family 88 protein [Pluralibacter sp.]MBV8043683.1 glycoside hydrolase family 88 protein [Pluralibacter sp.]
MSHNVNRRETLLLIEKLIDSMIAIEDNQGQFLQRLPDGRVIDTKGWAGWEWTHGIGLFGLFRYQEVTGSVQARQIIDDWFATRFAEGTPEKNINTACPFLTLSWRYQKEPRSDWRAYLETWGDALYRQMPRTDEGCMQHVTYENPHRQQIWDDTLMMAVLPLAKLGLLFDRPRWVEEAKFQFLQHLHYLTDRKSGLWFHGWNFEGRHHFAGALWARGNSWITLAIPELLEMLNLDEHDAFRRQLCGILENQAAALARSQCENGLWPTLLDDPQSYPEASATAGFAAGLLKAIRLGYLNASYLPAAQRALAGVIQHISPQGELTQVSFGTSMGHTLDHYRTIPLTPMPYGQAMAILCLVEGLYLSL